MQLSLAFLLASAVLLAVVAALVAIRNAARCSKLCSQLSATIDVAKKCARRVDELADTCVQMQDRYENLRARVGMRETRAARDAKQKESSALDNLTGSQWKAEARRRYAVKAGQHGPYIETRPEEATTGTVGAS